MKVTFTNYLKIATAFFALNLSAQKNNSSSTIYFQENKGQVCDQNYKPRPDVLFSGNANGINYHLTNTGISYQLSKIDRLREIEEYKTKQKIKIVDQTTVYRVDMNWVGVNLNSKITTGNVLPSVNNYYLAHCSDGVTNVQSFENIIYNNIYNNIDLKWYQKSGQLEYDFIVKPYANYEQIKIEINGAEKLSINAKGELEIKTPLGTITEQAPVAFQSNKTVETKWQIIDNTASFKILNYDKTQTLIIDPAIRLWGTYYGGTSTENGYGCTSDNSGNVFLSGRTDSNGGTIIATTGAHQTTLSSVPDAFLAKFNPSGVRQWGTYYGGAGFEESHFCTTDATGNVYMCGQTASTSSISTAGSHQSIFGGGSSDAFLVKFSSLGVRQWATYYGGVGVEDGNACATDNLGNVYFVGTTASTAAGTTIATSGSHQSSHAFGTNDGFLVKFNSLGVRQWGTFYGGAGNDDITCCTIEPGGNNIYIGGTVSFASTSGIATTGAHQTIISGSNDEAFLAKFNSAGVRQWGTYYGGTVNEGGQSCVVDASLNVYFCGFTGSSTGISTSGTHQVTIGGLLDAFLVKFNSTGLRQWGTYYGGSGDDLARSVSLDAASNVFIAGSTASPLSISTPNSYQTAFAGGSIGDGMVVKLNSSGVRQWGTYYGGTANDFFVTCDTKTANSIYLGGTTSSTASISSLGSHQSISGGLADGLLVKLYDCQELTLTISGSPTICSGSSTTLAASGVGFTTYTWSTASNSSSISVTPSVLTIYTLTAGTSTAGCLYSNTHTLNVITTPTVVVTPSTAVHCIGSNSTLITATGATTYSWSTSATSSTILVSPSVLTVYTVTGYNGSCSNIKTSTLSAAATPTINISGASTQTFCTGNTLTLTASASGANSYTWSNSITTPTVINASSASIITSPSTSLVYTVTGTNGLCNDTKTVNVSPVITPTVTINSSASSICAGGAATLTATGATTYSWNTSATTNSIAVSPTISTNYTVTGYNGACVNTKTTNIGIAASITISAMSNTPAICAGNSATLSANGASTYTWNTGSNGASIVVTPSMLTTYSVNGTSGSCSGSTTINVNVNPNPTVSVVSSSSVLCTGSSATLIANGANSYTWDTGGNVASITISPSVTTNYTVTGYTSFGCSNTSVYSQSVSLCSGLNEVNSLENSISIFPIPTSGAITIETLFTNINVIIYDAIGKIVLQNNINSNRTIIDLSPFAKGLYTLKFSSGSEVTNKKLIIE